ncbi:hypothetical protein GCM10023195_00590 [Actinoallomurus liliacearum]|uniref:HTH tetR-type domain-containing protein n=1 Tax=Actinoallomurus liliacearum TaxID=1080073 RepID=A0ABP8T8G9_9ACTN
MTITGVAERAGVSVGTIYRRFEDKDQLVAALTEPMLEPCFHNSVRPDSATGEAARHRYAEELSDMAIAYLLTPGRRAAASRG